MAAPEPPPDSLPPRAEGALPWLRRTQIVNQGTRYSFPPFSVHDDALIQEYLSDAKSYNKEINVLDRLQRTRTTGLNPDALQILLQALVDALPQPVQDRVGIHMGAENQDHGDLGPAIGSLDWFAQDDADFDRTLDLIRTGVIPPLNSNNREFILWVVNAGLENYPHFVTIVLHYEASDPSRPSTLDRISHWSVVDAAEDGEPSSRTCQRLTELLHNHGIQGATQREIWVPPPDEGEGFAHGFVAYSVVAQLLDRIGIAYSSGDRFEPDEFFAPTRPWFNADAVRAEALGRAAMVAMDRFQWKTRAGLFPVQPRINDGQREDVPVEELSPRLDPPQAYPVPVRPSAPEEKRLPLDLPSPASPSSAASVSQHAKFDLKEEEEEEEEQEQDLETLYYEFKVRESEEARQEERLAEDACLEAIQFARRVQHEVLESPGANIPSAFAVERLFRLVTRAIERSRAAVAAVRRIGNRSTSREVHDTVMHRLVTPLMERDFDRAGHTRRDMYTEADRILQAAYGARGGEIEEEEGLAQIEHPAAEDSARGAGAGVAREHEEQDRAPGKRKRGEAREVRRAGGPRGVKRERGYEVSEAVDEDGEEVYTVHVNGRRRRRVIQQLHGRNA